MKYEIISRALNEIDIGYINEALQFEPSFGKKNGMLLFWKNHRFAACIALICMLTAISFTTAMAASRSFREAVISIFYPLFTNDEIIEIEEGHRTGSFDETDTLLTFLNRFNTEKMERGILAKEEDGFSYTFVYDSSDSTKDSLLAIVETNVENYRLLVTMEKIPYEETSGLWQIVSYQIVPRKEAEAVFEKMSVYIPEKQEKTDTQKHRRMLPSKDCAMIYNATEKDKICELSKEESEQLRKMLDAYTPFEEVSISGPTDRVVKFEDAMYLISEKGEVLIDNRVTLMQITLSSDDFQILNETFEKYLGKRVGN